MKVIKVLLIILGITLILVVLSVKSFPEWLTIPGGLLVLLGLAFNAVLDAGGKLKGWMELFENKGSTQKVDELEHRQDTAVQEYFDRMTELILEKNLQQADKSSALGRLASMMTKTVLSGIDGNRKGLILKFLYESSLIGKPAQERPANSMNSEIIDLEGANFSGAVLQDIRLCEAVLVGANLDGANLTKSDLSISQPTFTQSESGWKLTGRGAFLIGTSLRNACLRGANLANAVLDDAILVNADLREANFQGAYIRSRKEDKKANFEGANLEGADFTNADLTGAINFDKAINVSKATLKGTVMPDGKPHN